MQRQLSLYLNQRPPPQKKVTALFTEATVLLKLLHFTHDSVVTRVTIIIFFTKVTNLLWLSKAPGVFRFRITPDLC